MARDLDRLDLPPAASSALAPRRRLPSAPGRDRDQFAQRALQSIRKIVDEHDRPDRRLRGYELDLLFKMRVHKHGGRDVRESLRRADCHTIVARHDDRFSWIVRANDKKLNRLQRDINASRAPKPTYVDAIEGFYVLDPSEKFGDLLRKRPMGESESNYVVVDILKKSDNDGNDLRNDTLAMIRALVAEHGFDVRDEFVSDGLCEVLVMANRDLLTALSLVDYVYRIDRQPEFQLSQAIEAGPNVDSAKILASPQGRP